MIRKLTSSFVVLVTLVSMSLGSESESLLPSQPQLPPSSPGMSSPRMLPVSQNGLAVQPLPSPMPESTHQRMLSTEGCDSGPVACETCPRQPMPLSAWWSTTWAGRLTHKVGEDTCKANRWPEPYVEYDREATKLAFSTMVEKGWKRQNTLGDVHFDPNTGELNMSGCMKVRRIVLEGLPSRRDLFVNRANMASDTETRLRSVQTFVNRLVAESQTPLPQVLVSNEPTPGWPAQYIDAISRKYVETMPDPRLPEKNEANFTEE